jgi:hypothetical protein
MTSVSDLQVLSSVPKLEMNSSNWIIFSIHLKWALQEKKVYGHLNGTSPKPAKSAEAIDKSTWSDDEAKAHHLLAQKLHDSTLTKLFHLDTVASMWTALTNEFTVKSSHIVATMHASFDSLKCTDNGNIRTHLDKLHFKYEELVSMGITILSEQYATRIVGSLPIYYQCHLSTIEASAHVSAFSNATTAANPANGTQSTPKSAFSIAPKLLMQLTVEEYDRIQASNTNHQIKAAKEDTGVALTVQGNSNGGKGGQFTHTAKNGKPYSIYWNCRGKGHIQNQCPSLSNSGLEKGKSSFLDDKHPSGGSSNSANAIMASEEDGVGLS